jgi:2-octaprenyl-6-methoxyphenol hydroxylase
MMKNNNFDVAIFGSGLTAKAMCLIAEHCGMSFVNIQGKQKEEKSEEDIRSLALSSASINMLKILGVEIEAQSVEKMIVFEGGVSDEKIKGKVIFNSEDLDDQIAFISEYGLIKKSLEGRLKLNKENSIKESPKSILAENNFSTITFNKSTSIKSKLNIFTERLDLNFQKIFQIKYESVDYEQTAITATLEHSKDHKGYAYQFFLKNGPLALLPLRKRKTKNYSSLVWTEKTFNAHEILSSAKDLEKKLNDMCSIYLGKIKVSTQPISFPLKKVSCKTPRIDRNLFVGDAIRSMHPLAGQAWNQSLRDLAYIADALVESKKLGIDIMTCPSMKSFEGKRQFEGNAFVEGISFINAIFKSESSLAKGIRRNLMKIFNKEGPLKSLLANEASGGALERPSLLMNKPAGSKTI